MISLLTFSYLAVTVFADDEPSRSSYFINAENRRLVVQMTKRLYSTSALSCSHACLKNPWCFSTNFKYGTGGSKGVCDLIKASESTKDNKKLIYQPGNTFTVILKVSIVVFVCAIGSFSNDVFNGNERR